MYMAVVGSPRRRRRPTSQCHLLFRDRLQTACDPAQWLKTIM